MGNRENDNKFFYKFINEILDFHTEQHFCNVNRTMLAKLPPSLWLNRLSSVLPMVSSLIVRFDRKSGIYWFNCIDSGERPYIHQEIQTVQYGAVIGQVNMAHQPPTVSFFSFFNSNFVLS